jgi:hypothetical protein
VAELTAAHVHAEEGNSTRSPLIPDLAFFHA